MNDDLPHNGAPANRSQASAIETTGTAAGHVDALLRVHAQDALDQRAITGMAKNDHIPFLQTTQEEGQGDQEHEIAVPILRGEAISGNAEEAEHRLRMSIWKKFNFLAKLNFLSGRFARFPAYRSG